MPPTSGLGLLGQAHEGFGQLRGSAVDAAHGFNIEAAQRHLAGLDTPELGFGPLQLFGGLAHRQALAASEVTEVAAELSAGDGRAGGLIGHCLRTFPS